MDLKIENLFEVVYPSYYSDDKIKHLKSCLNDIKIDNLININKHKRNKFFIVVTESNNILDFKIDPFFEIIDISSEIPKCEDSDYIILNDGISDNNYNNFTTNINLNLIDIKNNHSVNKLSIKKIIHSLNFPEELLDQLPDDMNIFDYNTENLFSELSDIEGVTEYEDEVEHINEDDIDNVDEDDIDNVDEDIDNVSEDNGEAEYEDEDEYIDVEENDEELLQYLPLCKQNKFLLKEFNKYKNDVDNIKKIKLVRKHQFQGFDFNICSTDSKIYMITDVSKKGRSHKKLVKGDLLLYINDVQLLNLSYDEIVKLINSSLELNLVINTKNRKKTPKFVNNEKFYRIIGKKYIKLSLFEKKYNNETNKCDKKQISYINSFIFNDEISYPYCLDTNSDMNLDINIDQKFFTYNYYDEFFVDYGETQYFDEHLDDYDSFYDLPEDFFVSLHKLKSGYYFNPKSIGWQIFLGLSLCMFADKSLILNCNYKNFKNKTVKQLYFPNFKKSEASIFEKETIKVINITCDVCNNIIATKLSHKVYGNKVSGDICEKCYNIKKEQFFKRIKYLKHLILLVGKREVFKKEVEKTRKFLKTYKFKKIKKNAFYNLLENVNKSIIINNENEKICKICFDTLDDNLSVAVECGHCFHTACIEKTGLVACPACRKQTHFKKLYF